MSADGRDDAAVVTIFKGSFASLLEQNRIIPLPLENAAGRGLV